MLKLNVEKSFTDKYTNIKYKIGDVIEVETARGEELLADPRQLVSLNAIIEKVVKEKTTKKRSK